MATVVLNLQLGYLHLAWFPGSPLAPMKSENGGGEPGIN